MSLLRGRFVDWGVTWLVALTVLAWAGPVEELRSADESVRWEAVRKVRQGEQYEVVPVLLEVLEGEPLVWLRRDILETLAVLRPLCERELRERVRAACERHAQEDPSPAGRAFALVALESMPEVAAGHEARFESLLGLLDDTSDLATFRVILQALGRFEHPGRVAALQARVGLPGERGWWTRVSLWELSPPDGLPWMLAALREALASPEASQRGSALNWLPDLGAEARPLLPKVLELTSDPGLQSQAVHTWLSLGGELESVYPVLAKACRDWDCARVLADVLRGKPQRLPAVVEAELRATPWPWLHEAITQARGDPDSLGTLLDSYDYREQARLPEAAAIQAGFPSLLQELRDGRWSPNVLRALLQAGASPAQMLEVAEVLLSRADPAQRRAALEFLSVQSQTLGGPRVVRLLLGVVATDAEPSLRDLASDQLYFNHQERQSLAVLDYVVLRRGWTEPVDSPAPLRAILAARYRRQLATSREPGERLRLLAALTALLVDPAPLVEPLLATPATGHGALYAQVVGALGPDLVASRCPDPQVLVRALAEMSPPNEFHGGPVVEALLCCEPLRPEVVLPRSQVTWPYLRALGVPDPTPSPYAEAHPLTAEALAQVPPDALAPEVEGLAFQAGLRALPLLLEFAQSEDARLQRAALRGLKWLGESHAGAGWELVQPVLKRVFAHGDLVVKVEALEAAEPFPGFEWGFARLTELARQELARQGGMRDYILQRVARYQHPGVVAFLSSLDEATALEFLLWVRSAPAARAARPLLLRQLRSAQPLKALQQLREFKPRCWEARPLVLAALRDPRPAVQGAAAAAWWELSYDARPLLPYLRQQQARRDPEVLSLLWPMASQGPEFSALIASCLESLPRDQVSGLLHTMGLIGRQQMLPGLLRSAQARDPRKREAGLYGLQELARSGMDLRPSLREALVRHPNAGLAALLATLSAPPPSPDEELVRLAARLRQPDERQKALWEVRGSKAPGVLAVLLEALAEGHIDVLSEVLQRQPSGAALASAARRCQEARGDLTVAEWGQLLSACHEDTPDRQALVAAALAHRESGVRVAAAPLAAHLTPQLLREVLAEPGDPGGGFSGAWLLRLKPEAELEPVFREGLETLPLQRRYLCLEVLWRWKPTPDLVRSAEKLLAEPSPGGVSWVVRIFGVEELAAQVDPAKWLTVLQSARYLEDVEAACRVLLRMSRVPPEADAVLARLATNALNPEVRAQADKYRRKLRAKRGG